VTVRMDVVEADVAGVPAMVFVELRLNSLDLSSHMAEMRIWLDRNCVDTVGFSYREQVDHALARIVFTAKAAAEAFAARFAGHVISDIASPPAQIAPPSPQRTPL
jgi:hypothetical protein